MPHFKIVLPPDPRDHPAMDVITLTGNLLAEWTFDTGPLTPGATHRATGMSFQVGGKGINVARVLGRLGAAPCALGFADGPLAALCGEWLAARGIAHAFFPLGGGVRPGVVIRAGDAPETTFLGMDLAVPDASWQAACAHAAAARPDWLAVCGSIPGWQAGWCGPLRELAGAAGPLRLCADTYGAPLQDLARIPLDLVKINRVELDRLLPECAGRTTRDALALARERFAARNWIITDGPRPLVADFAEAGAYTVIPARLREVSPTGSGDTFLAAFINGWQPGQDPAPALLHAGACASANAASPGIGDFALPVADAYLPQVSALR